jgi:hypothetical protein
VENQSVQRIFLCYFLLGQKVTKKATTHTNLRMAFAHQLSPLASHPEVRTMRGRPPALGENILRLVVLFFQEATTLYFRLFKSG